MPPVVTFRDLYTERISVAQKDRSYQRGWRTFKTDGGVLVPYTASDAMAEALARFPINSTFPGLPGVILTRHDVEDYSPNTFTVTGAYSVPETPPTPDNFDEFMAKSGQPRSASNPYGPRRSRTTMLVDEYDYKDLKNKWFKNTAGDPLQTLIPIPAPISVIRVTLAMRSEPDDGQVGKAMGPWLFANVESDSELHLNKATGVYTPYVTATFEAWYNNRRNWVPTIVWDAGYNELKTVAGKKEKHPIKGPNGQIYNNISFLNGSGVALPPGSENLFPLEFHVREETQLSIPFIV